MKKFVLTAAAAVSLLMGATVAEARGGPTVYTVQSEFNSYRVRVALDQQYGADFEDVMQRGHRIRVCNRAGACAWVASAGYDPKIYTVYDHDLDINDMGLGFRHSMVPWEAHEKGMRYRICRISFAPTPQVQPDCRTY